MGLKWKKEKYIVPSTLTDPLVKLFFIKTSARKLLQNNVFTTRPQQPLYATLSKHQFIHTTTKTLDAIATTKTINLKKRYSKIYQSSQQENRYIWQKTSKISTTTMISKKSLIYTRTRKHEQPYQHQNRYILIKKIINKSINNYGFNKKNSHTQLPTCIINLINTRVDRYILIIKNHQPRYQQQPWYHQ